MTTINHETYCGQDLIELLLKAGFDWQEYFVAHHIDEHFHWEIPLHIAQRWLREVKEMYAEAYLSESHHTPVWIASVYLWENRPLGRELRDKCLCTGIGPVHFDTYEQALEEGIKKCLKILLQK